MIFKRTTIITTQLMSILQNSDHPLSTTQLLALLKQKGHTPNKSTIYRILDKLVTHKKATLITLKNGISYYELSTNTHHHHFFCTKCETIYCLNHCHIHQNNINLNELLPHPEFKVSDHDFNLYGTCNQCV